MELGFPPRIPEPTARIQCVFHRDLMGKVRIVSSMNWEKLTRKKDTPIE